MSTVMITGGSRGIGAATARVATAGVAPYATFKGGREVPTRYMAKEFGEHRIQVNAQSIEVAGGYII
ncbi:short-chain dehydrogenase [Alcanivorax balearicus MACL04]|uniref:Short-chain dehydrogenase n=1 Tax=Alloalcanivorax balearicus MACL04 TaxID=1177182 RepID=A0ABT2QXU0_9GAMM|nr:hypothetical protein [Alloalcanivorax balearicus]MCU5782318.1 short-chain dehydrogenase [Alloalcanivorax balearicus MACL04]